MSMLTTRNLRNRSSRYSSPATFAENNAPPKPVETQKISNGGQTSSEKWVEPPLRNPVASFEDTKGLERVGVLEHMAPLGVPPSQKLLQKLKVNLNRSSARATPVNAEDATPPMEPAGLEVASPVDTEPLPESARLDNSIVISSPPRGRPAKKELDEMKQVVDITSPSPVKTTFSSVQASPRPQSIQDYIKEDRMKGVVEHAVAEANSNSDLKLVPGLQKFWEDAKAKPQLWAILDAVLHKTPTDAQFRIFKKYIKNGVRQYRRSSSAHTTSHSASHVVSPQSQSTILTKTLPSYSASQAYGLLDNHQLSSPHRRMDSIDQQLSPTYDHPMSPTSKVAMLPGDKDFASDVRHRRSRSASTSSSLSSAKSMPEDFSPETIEIDDEGQAAEGRPVRLAGQRQASTRVAAESRTRSSIIPQSEPPQRQPNLPTSIKFVSKKPKSTTKKEDPTFDPEKVEAKRRELQDSSFLDYNNIERQQSDERTIVRGIPISQDAILMRIPPPVVHPNPLPPSIAALFSPTVPQTKPELLLTNGAGRKRPYDEVDKDDIDSITPLSSSPPPPFATLASTAVHSTRGATPRAAKLPPPNKTKKSARVMVSPNKPKNGGITAGISRAGPVRDVVIGNGADSGAEDNDEFCASCGGEGILLCCDGCTNSFHHGCLEPPLNPDDEVEGEWFCPRCIARRHKETSPVTGLMGQIIRRVDHTIPKAYALPFDIREYFEGVKTGDEGEYEEVGLPRTQNTGAKMNRAGFFEEPSYKELRDNKGNFIICYRCQKTSNGRDIIPCDYCPAKWHTDCVDPPLAVPPRRRGGDKPTGYWRCPLHIEGDLADLGRQVEAAPGDLGRVPRLRKPRKAFPIDVHLPRGFRNNGVIEVELMKDEMPDIKDVALDGGIYRLPERGIQLDFIDRVKKSWYEDQVFPKQLNSPTRIRQRLYRPDDPVLHHPAAYTVVKHREPEFFKGVTAVSVAETARVNAQLRHKSFREQSAVMSLIGLSQQLPTGRSVDPLTDLTNCLVAEAPDEVSEAVNLSEKDTLLRLQKLINSRLALLQTPEKTVTTKVDTKATKTALSNGNLTEDAGDDNTHDVNPADSDSEMDLIS